MGFVSPRCNFPFVSLQLEYIEQVAVAVTTLATTRFPSLMTFHLKLKLSQRKLKDNDLQFLLPRIKRNQKKI